MKKILLEETKLGKSIAVSCELVEDEMGLYIAAADVSAICVFRFEEWDNFVRAITKANEKFKGLFPIAKFELLEEEIASKIKIMKGRCSNQRGYNRQSRPFLIHSFQPKNCWALLPGPKGTLPGSRVKNLGGDAFRYSLISYPEI